MSNYKEYGKRLEKAVFDGKAKIDKQAQRVQDAKQYYWNIRGARGEKDYYESDETRAQRIWEAEQKKQIEMERRYQSEVMEEIKKIRAELVEEINEDFSADPAKIDANTMELLKGGILTGAEYETLFNKATRAGNVTMARMIAKYAGDALQETKDQGSAEAQLLKFVNNAGKQIDGREYIEAFDNLTEIVNRSCNNPAMWPYWDELATPIIESMEV